MPFRGLGLFSYLASFVGLVLIITLILIILNLYFRSYYRSRSLSVMIVIFLLFIITGSVSYINLHRFFERVENPIKVNKEGKIERVK
jgi:hypothetical protein